MEENAQSELQAAVSSTQDVVLLAEAAAEHSDICEPRLNADEARLQQTKCFSTGTSPSKLNNCEAKPVNAAITSNPSLAVRFSDICQDAENSAASPSLAQQYESKLKELAEQNALRQEQLEQLNASVMQKDNMIQLLQRENLILDREKQALRREKETATQEKESTVIKFAMQEKQLIDAKKEYSAIEKQLADAKKENKNISQRFQAINEEKSRLTYVIDEKCNEVRKYQRECEKLKTDYVHLESKLKYHVNKLNMELEAKQLLEKKLEDERNAPGKNEEKANEKLRVELEAKGILLKHEIDSKSEAFDNLQKEHQQLVEQLKSVQDQLARDLIEKNHIEESYHSLKDEYDAIQNSYSEEMLASAKLRAQLDEFQVLKTQNTLNIEKIAELKLNIEQLEESLHDNTRDLQQLRSKEEELLSINKEMSESIVLLQNEVCMLKSKIIGLEAENAGLTKEQTIFDGKYRELQQKLEAEIAQKSEERQLLAKHLSEKTKLYEVTKCKLDNILGEFEATQHKHANVVKELQREIQIYKKNLQHTTKSITEAVKCKSCQAPMNSMAAATLPQSRCDSPCSPSNSSAASVAASGNSRRISESSESADTVTAATEIQQEGPSKKQLVERILRLQKAATRQTEKIDFLENHSLSLVAELQKKTKVLQYYMLRDQSGALTSSKSDQNKTDLAKYGNGVMAAIYSGFKGGDNKSMNLELSLEINKKLQAVLEDTLLKNITLKENLDVLGLEVDNLTRKLRAIELKQ